MIIYLKVNFFFKKKKFHSLFFIRKSDFAMILATRRAIRHDVKPFTTFIKKTSVSPEIPIR